MKRQIRLMPDYGLDPLWGPHPDDKDYNDLSVFPLSQETVLALRAWADWFDSFLNWQSPHDSREVSPEESAAFDAEGRRLWRVLRRELGDGYEVLYQGENGFLRPEDDTEP